MDLSEYPTVAAPTGEETVTQHALPNSPPTGYKDEDSTLTVASVDVTINDTNKTWLRVFHPLNLPPNKKLPVVFYFHGGGFIRHSAASKPFHDMCNHMARELPAIILSVEYRLAPQHRLPAPYEDAIDALLWLKQQALHGGVEEQRFVKCADFNQCFLMGSSSGGNIVYHAGLRALDLDLAPVKIVGLIMNQPGFLGSEKSASELKFVNDPVLTPSAIATMLKLSTPIEAVGNARDHEYCNPTDRPEIKKLPRCYVNGHGGDPLVDRQKEFVKMLEKHGVSVVSRFYEDGYHAVELFEPIKFKAFVMDVKDFIYPLTAAAEITNHLR